MRLIVLESSPVPRCCRERVASTLEFLPTTPISCSCSSFGGVPPESSDNRDMMASLAIGKALGSVEKIDDEYVFGDMDNEPLPLELNCREMRGRRESVTTVSTGGTSEGDPWGKKERCEAGTLRISEVISRGLVDDDSLTP